MIFPLITFPDVELLVVDYLRERFADVELDYADGVTFGTRVPTPLPLPFVEIRRQGGARLDIIRDLARIDVWTWHEGDKQAQDLAQLVRGFLHQLPGVHGDAVVYRVVEFAGLVRLADPDSDLPRWLTSLEIDVRGATFEPPGS